MQTVTSKQKPLLDTTSSLHKTLTTTESTQSKEAISLLDKTLSLLSLDLSLPLPPADTPTPSPVPVIVKDDIISLEVLPPGSDVVAAVNEEIMHSDGQKVDVEVDETGNVDIVKTEIVHVSANEAGVKDKNEQASTPLMIALQNIEKITEVADIKAVEEKVAEVSKRITHSEEPEKRLSVSELAQLITSKKEEPNELNAPKKLVVTGELAEQQGNADLDKDPKATPKELTLPRSKYLITNPQDFEKTLGESIAAAEKNDKDLLNHFKQLVHNYFNKLFPKDAKKLRIAKGEKIEGDDDIDSDELNNEDEEEEDVDSQNREIKVNFKDVTDVFHTAQDLIDIVLDTAHRDASEEQVQKLVAELVKFWDTRLKEYFTLNPPKKLYVNTIGHLLPAAEAKTETKPAVIAPDSTTASTPQLTQQNTTEEVSVLAPSEDHTHEPEKLLDSVLGLTLTVDQLARLKKFADYKLQAMTTPTKHHTTTLREVAESAEGNKAEAKPVQEEAPFVWCDLVCQGVREYCDDMKRTNPSARRVFLEALDKTLQDLLPNYIDEPKQSDASAEAGTSGGVDATKLSLGDISHRIATIMEGPLDGSTKEKLVKIKDLILSKIQPATEEKASDKSSKQDISSNKPQVEIVDFSANNVDKTEIKGDVTAHKEANSPENILKQIRELPDPEQTIVSLIDEKNLPRVIELLSTSNVTKAVLLKEVKKLLNSLTEDVNQGPSAEEKKPEGDDSKGNTGQKIPEEMSDNKKEDTTLEQITPSTEPATATQEPNAVPLTADALIIKMKELLDSTPEQEIRQEVVNHLSEHYLHEFHKDHKKPEPTIESLLEQMTDNHHLEKILHSLAQRLALSNPATIEVLFKDIKDEKTSYELVTTLVRRLAQNHPNTEQLYSLVKLCLHKIESTTQPEDFRVNLLSIMAKHGVEVSSNKEASKSEPTTSTQETVETQAPALPPQSNIIELIGKLTDKEEATKALLSLKQKLEELGIDYSTLLPTPAAPSPPQSQETKQPTPESQPNPAPAPPKTIESQIEESRDQEHLRTLSNLIAARLAILVVPPPLPPQEKQEESKTAAEQVAAPDEKVIAVEEVKVAEVQVAASKEIKISVDDVVQAIREMTSKEEIQKVLEAARSKSGEEQGVDIKTVQFKSSVKEGEPVKQPEPAKVDLGVIESYLNSMQDSDELKKLRDIVNSRISAISPADIQNELKSDNTDSKEGKVAEKVVAEGKVISKDDIIKEFSTIQEKANLLQTLIDLVADEKDLLEVLRNLIKVIEQRNIVEPYILQRLIKSVSNISNTDEILQLYELIKNKILSSNKEAISKLITINDIQAFIIELKNSPSDLQTLLTSLEKIVSDSIPPKRIEITSQDVQLYLSKCTSPEELISYFKQIESAYTQITGSQLITPAKIDLTEEEVLKFIKTHIEKNQLTPFSPSQFITSLLSPLEQFIPQKMQPPISIGSSPERAGNQLSPNNTSNPATPSLSKACTLMLNATVLMIRSLDHILCSLDVDESFRKPLAEALTSNLAHTEEYARLRKIGDVESMFGIMNSEKRSQTRLMEIVLAWEFRSGGVQILQKAALSGKGLSRS